MKLLFLIPHGRQILFLIYNNNLIICTDRARICFKCYIEKGRKFENALVEKSESSTNLK